VERITYGSLIKGIAKQRIVKSGRIWRARRDLNPRPTDSKLFQCTHSEGPRRQTYPILLNISTFIFSFVPALPVQSGHQLVANEPPVDQLAYKFTIRSNTESQGTTGERSVVFTGFRLFSFPSHPVTTAHCGSKMVADGDENHGIAYRHYDCWLEKRLMKSDVCSYLLPLCYHSNRGLSVPLSSVSTA